MSNNFNPTNNPELNKKLDELARVLADIIQYVADTIEHDPTLATSQMPRDILAAVATQLTRGNKAPRSKKATNKKSCTEQKNTTIKQNFYKLKRNRQPIPDDMNAELARRFPTYDPATRAFRARKPKSPKPAEKPKSPKTYAQKASATLYKKHRALTRAGKTIPDELNAELTRRFPNYDPLKRAFVRGRKKSQPAKATPTHDATPKTTLDAATAPATAPKPEKATKLYTSVASTPLAQISDAALREKLRVARIHDDVSAELNDECIKRFPTYDPKTHKILSKTAAANAAPTPAPRAPNPALNAPTLTVTVKTKKITANGLYADVYVNGVRILKDHVDTRLETFMGGTVLGVYGIATDIKDIPAVPQWQIFDTNLTPKRFEQRMPLSKNKVYIVSTARNGDDTELRLGISNKMQVIMKKKPGNKIFNLMTEQANDHSR